MNFHFLIFLGLIGSFVKEISCLENPYNILGVDKKSSLQTIKKAYKQLAKEW